MNTRAWRLYGAKDARLEDVELEGKIIERRIELRQ